MCGSRLAKGRVDGPSDEGTSARATVGVAPEERARSEQVRRDRLSTSVVGRRVQTISAGRLAQFEPSLTRIGGRPNRGQGRKACRIWAAIPPHQRIEFRASGQGGRLAVCLGACRRDQSEPRLRGFRKPTFHSAMRVSFRFKPAFESAVGVCVQEGSDLPISRGCMPPRVSTRRQTHECRLLRVILGA
jgi:hypothetical protein